MQIQIAIHPWDKANYCQVPSKKYSNDKVRGKKEGGSSPQERVFSVCTTPASICFCFTATPVTVLAHLIGGYQNRFPCILRKQNLPGNLPPGALLTVDGQLWDYDNPNLLLPLGKTENLTYCSTYLYRIWIKLLSSGLAFPDISLPLCFLHILLTNLLEHLLYKSTVTHCPTLPRAVGLPETGMLLAVQTLRQSWANQDAWSSCSQLPRNLTSGFPRGGLSEKMAFMLRRNQPLQSWERYFLSKENSKY